jgi:hypothetical protein
LKNKQNLNVKPIYNSYITLSLAKRSCLTTTISANKSTRVTEVNKDLAALTTAPRSRKQSSPAVSQSFSMALPIKKKKVEYLR